jgi:methionyl-tRNA formyltransferase
MRIVFAGTPEFARQALVALVQAGHDIVLVLTQPDRPSGRGMKQRASVVKIEAEARQIPVYQPERLKDPAMYAPILGARPELMVVAAYGLILPQAVLEIPKYGCVNIHASLLPRWRGAAPIQRAIEAGDRETGICIMQMEAGLDTGPVLSTSVVPIRDSDTAGALHDVLAKVGARAIVDALEGLHALKPVAQSAEGVSYAAKVTKEDALLDWNRASDVLARKVRAFNPTPGAWTVHNKEQIKIWQALPATSSGEAGRILVASTDELIVACGSGALEITELQRPGSKRMPRAAFLAGYPLKAGSSLGS